jgi:serine/threonine-protein kinase RsbW
MNDVPESDTRGVLLTVAAIPENVALVRQVLAGLADALRIDAARTADIKIAVTEACTNVVLHAYPDATGALEVSLAHAAGNVAVGVRDAGIGFRPASPFEAATDSDALPVVGFGLALIASLADEFGIVAGSAGTEVQMVFALGDEPPPDPARLFTGGSRPAPPREAAPERVLLSIGREEPAVELLGRVVSLLAARAGFSIDRLSDAQLVSDAVATHAPAHARNGHLSICATEHVDAFELEVGPFEPDRARALVSAAALPGVGSLLERLSEVAIEPDADRGGSDRLRLRLARSAPAV